MRLSLPPEIEALAKRSTAGVRLVWFLVGATVYRLAGPLGCFCVACALAVAWVSHDLIAGSEPKGIGYAMLLCIAVFGALVGLVVLAMR
jgi:hypothetical protein